LCREASERQLLNIAESLKRMGELLWGRKQYDELGYRAYVANACGIS
jgi:hypothetical protein